MRGDRESVMNAGFDGYLSKPINARDLANEIERLSRRPEDRAASPPSPRILNSPVLGARS
jgi:DNA-binding response OmpR family regulator